MPEALAGRASPADRPLLAVRDLHAWYGESHVLHGVSFEVGKGEVGKGGVVRDESARRGAVEKIRTWAAAHGFTAHEDVESPITGPAGNVEYLILLRTAEPSASA